MVITGRVLVTGRGTIDQALRVERHPSEPIACDTGELFAETVKDAGRMGVGVIDHGQSARAESVDNGSTCFGQFNQGIGFGDGANAYADDDLFRMEARIVVCHGKIQIIVTGVVTVRRVPVVASLYSTLPLSISCISAYDG